MRKSGNYWGRGIDHTSVVWSIVESKYFRNQLERHNMVARVRDKSGTYFNPFM